MSEMFTVLVFCCYACFDDFYGDKVYLYSLPSTVQVMHVVIQMHARWLKVQHLKAVTALKGFKSKVKECKYSFLKLGTNACSARTRFLKTCFLKYYEYNMSKRHCFYSNLKTFAPYWSVWNFYSFILFHLKIKETSKSGTLLNTSKEGKKTF